MQQLLDSTISTKGALRVWIISTAKFAAHMISYDFKSDLCARVVGMNGADWLNIKVHFQMVLL